MDSIRRSVSAAKTGPAERSACRARRTRRLPSGTARRLGSDYLTCMVPRVIAADMYDAFRPGGAFLLNTLITWGLRTAGHTAQSIDNDELVDVFHTLPLIDMDRLAGRRLAAWRDWMGHVTYDSYWHDQNVDGRWDEIAAPAFLMSGWYDLYSKQVFTDFNSMRRHARTSDARKSKVIVGPWPHHLSISTRTGEVDFGAASMVNLNAMETRWFDYWLKGHRQRHRRRAAGAHLRDGDQPVA